MSKQIEMEAEGISSPSSIDTRLSYSSASLLKNCEQKYHYHKVSKVPKDKDAAARDNSHFAIGKSFHYILETTLHEKPENISDLLDTCVQVEGLKEEDRGLVHAMVLSYLRLRKGSRIKVVGCEWSITHEHIIGFVDAIEVDTETGDFYISDLKTAATFYDSKLAELPSDTQLNLYASFYREIAEHYNLDPDKFKGVRYLVTTKSKAKQQAREDYSGYVMRMVDKKLVKSIFVTIPKEMMRIDKVRKEHEELHDKSMKLRSGEIKPSKNFTYCNAFFKSCDFFSRCHGAQNSEIMENASIVIERTK